jgi:hypothetical protein
LTSSRQRDQPEEDAPSAASGLRPGGLPCCNLSARENHISGIIPSKPSSQHDGRLLHGGNRPLEILSTRGIQEHV